MKIRCQDCGVMTNMKCNAQKICLKCRKRKANWILEMANAENKSIVLRRHRRYCIGVFCRGDKMFTSLNGHRLCVKCRDYIKGNENCYDF